MRRFLRLGVFEAIAAVAILAMSQPGIAAAAPAPSSSTPQGPSPAVAATLPGYHPLVPVRICDTRAAGPGVAANQCDTAGHSALSTGGILNVTVAGAAGVPADATAVVIHVTATATNAASYLTVWPTGVTKPTAASLNWSPGQTVPNLVQTGVGTGGQVSVFNYAGSVDVVVDLEGYFGSTAGSLFVPVTPTRVCDTRFGQAANQCNSGGAAAGTLGPGGTRSVTVTNSFGVPVGATAVVLNITATATTAASYLDVWPHGAALPLASSLNWTAGQTISNRAVITVGAGGVIDMFNAYGRADVVMDLAGYFTSTLPGSGFFPIAPVRLCDTRPVGPGVGANPCNGAGVGTLPSGGALVLSGFDPTFSAVVVNVTVTNTAAAGYLTVFPDDSAEIPFTADITWAAHQTIGNLTVANLGSTAAMAIFNGSSGSTDVVLDAVGFYSATAPASPSGATAQPRSAMAPITVRREQLG